jgi:peptidoglycan/xylan/chitin deacetylase (PgdA/CDA1 family)
MKTETTISRRQWLAASSAGIVVGAVSRGVSAAAKCAIENEEDAPALVAITLDLEMSRNFPTRETMHWDFEKGNLNAETKAYAVEAARRVKARGGRLHFFVVGRVLEQENVEWLKQLAADGHPLGNHTYDHVNVTATKPEDIQFRFQRSPWLIEGQKPADVIRENIRLTTTAMKSRLNVAPAGFRTPGGFGPGLADREDIQRMLLELGFKWISSKYPAHPINPPKEGDPPMEPADELIAGIVAAQANAQPFVYPSGLVEVPMSPISDIGAFRTGRWKLEWFLRAIRAGVTWAIENQACFDFLGHPSCLYVTDPEFKTIDLMCDLVEKAGPKAKLADLEALSQRAKKA